MHAPLYFPVFSGAPRWPARANRAQISEDSAGETTEGSFWRRKIQNFFVRPKSSPPRKVRAAFSIGGGDLAWRLGNAGPRGFQRPRAPGCARAHSRQAVSSVRQDTHGSPPAHQRLLPEPTLQCVRMCAPVGGLLAALAMVFGMAVAFAPKPRITWEHREVHLEKFHEPGIFNYSVLLLSEDKTTLYVGAREAVFALSAHNVSEKQHEAYWKVSEDKKAKCAEKGKSRQTECLNYIRVLQPLGPSALYVCGTNAFQPACDRLDLASFKFLGRSEDGKGRCPFDPAQSYTSVMVDGELYSGTSYNFLGSEPIISRHSSHSPLRTEYAIPWLNEPSFVFADVMRERPDGVDSGDDRVYFFFTEVSVEYEFVFKLMIPRVARVCKGDQGGLRTLQKKWTSFLKARLICSRPDSNLVFNVLQDVFVHRAEGLKEPVIYGVFTPQLNNVGLSAVCAYNLSTAEEVFSRGKYMQSTTVEQSHTKWVRYNGAVPSPRPGACINREARAANFSSSLSLPDKTLQFVKDHPLMDSSVTPIDNRPRLIRSDVNYTQVVVDRTWALDGTPYDVMFVGTDRGTLHKAVSLENEAHIIEETRLFQDLEPVQTLLLNSQQGRKFVYAGSSSGVVQAPVAFCEKHATCEDCVLARDPYCAWSPASQACVALHPPDSRSRDLIQRMSGDTSGCPTSSVPFAPPGSASLSCRGPGSASSPRSPRPASGSNSGLPVTLLPPFLSDQAQHVRALGTFHLFCQATGPADIRFTWEKNGRELQTCVPTHTHALRDGRTHALSWLRDAVGESTEYRCSVISSAGNRTSGVRVTIMRHGEWCPSASTSPVTHPPHAHACHVTLRVSVGRCWEGHILRAQGSSSGFTRRTGRGAQCWPERSPLPREACPMSPRALRVAFPDPHLHGPHSRHGVSRPGQAHGTGKPALSFPPRDAHSAPLYVPSSFWNYPAKRGTAWHGVEQGGDPGPHTASNQPWRPVPVPSVSGRVCLLPRYWPRVQRSRVCPVPTAASAFSFQVLCFPSCFWSVLKHFHRCLRDAGKAPILLVRVWGEKTASFCPAQNLVLPFLSSTPCPATVRTLGLLPYTRLTSHEAFCRNRENGTGSTVWRAPWWSCSPHPCPAVTQRTSVKSRT
ncbi:semaphorin-4D isoform X3 [Meles meles]|uniref:semaphorin-4D isoform X3 n=1 Tax=Meles meles TaxID=9662 RepID=UPI001E6986A4|nr:semaphorin-4D isoform X3 [Meles meles]